MRKAVAVIFLLFLASCGDREPKPPIQLDTVDDYAEDYVKLALAYGPLDTDYVDAYTGPEEWRLAAEARKADISTLLAEADTLAAGLRRVIPEAGEEMRLKALRGNVKALRGRMQHINGRPLLFDQETYALYDVVIPALNPDDFKKAIAALDVLLPGEGSIAARKQALREAMTVPADKVPDLMKVAITACRERTIAHYDLPESERFDLEFVTGKSWSAYNYYQGDFKSLIQVNLDQPFTIDRAIDLGCHEGYPGHHVYNIYTEQIFLRQNKWVEYYVLPLFSPAAFFTEGSANYGQDIAFPGDSRIAFEKEILYPLAGLDPRIADLHKRVEEASKPLGYVRTWVARQYLDGQITREHAIELQQEYGLSTQSRAAQQLDFIDQYRAYVINYVAGQDLVRAYVEAKSTTEEDRWVIFEQLLSTPLSASDMALE